MNRRRRKIKPYKVSRGAFEEQKLREDKKTETQRALLFILPVLMLAVLAVGIFFGYKSYRQSVEDEKKIIAESSATEEEEVDPILLTVVSPAYPLDESYVPTLSEVRGTEVNSLMAEDLEKMLFDASSAGCPLVLKEGYISFEEQKERYEKAVEKYLKKSKMTLVKAESQVKKTTSREGESEQQTGLLVRLDDEGEEKFQDSDAFRWLQRHAVDYGFILRYPSSENVGGLSYSPNLYRYVGRENAYRMRAYNMTFDEYASYMAFQ